MFAFCIGRENVAVIGSPAELCEHKPNPRTKAPWLSQREEREARILLLCITVFITVVTAVLLLKVRGIVAFHRPARHPRYCRGIAKAKPIAPLSALVLRM